MTVGANLKRLREGLIPRVTQTELARRLGLKGNGNISTWETSTAIPTPETVRRWAAALGVATSEFYVGVELPHDVLREPQLPHLLRAAETAVREKDPAILRKKPTRRPKG